MALNAFMEIAGAKGESTQFGYENWIPLQGWDWEVTSDCNFTKGGGAMIGKASPGTLNWEHFWDRASPALLGYIATGSAFETVKLHMCKTTGSKTPEPFWTANMTEVFITKVNQSATDEGNISQKVEMVFRMIEIEYKDQSSSTGTLGAARTFKWNIPEGDASPGAP